MDLSSVFLFSLHLLQTTCLAQFYWPVNCILINIWSVHALLILEQFLVVFVRCADNGQQSSKFTFKICRAVDTDYNSTVVLMCWFLLYCSWDSLLRSRFFPYKHCEDEFLSFDLLILFFRHFQTDLNKL